MSDSETQTPPALPMNRAMSEARRIARLERDDLKRARGTTLPLLLNLVAGGTLIFGVLAGVLLIANNSYALGIPVAIGSATSAALLAGFADLVSSMRTIARHTIK